MVWRWEIVSVPLSKFYCRDIQDVLDEGQEHEPINRFMGFILPIQYIPAIRVVSFSHPQSDFFKMDRV